MGAAFLTISIELVAVAIITILAVAIIVTCATVATLSTDEMLVVVEAIPAQGVALV